MKKELKTSRFTGWKFGFHTAFCIFLNLQPQNLVLIHFLVNAPVICPLKTPELKRFSGIFKGINKNIG